MSCREGRADPEMRSAKSTTVCRALQSWFVALLYNIYIYIYIYIYNNFLWYIKNNFAYFTDDRNCAEHFNSSWTCRCCSICPSLHSKSFCWPRPLSHTTNHRAGGRGSSHCIGCSAGGWSWSQPIRARPGQQHSCGPDPESAGVYAC